MGSPGIIDGGKPRAARAVTAEPAQQSLRDRAVRASLWILTGHGASQALRLVSSVLIARLLFPEALGLMALVSVFMQGLQMFSDVGIGPSIVQGRRGDDPVYLKTAWTLQIMRGIALAAVGCALAVPIAAFYGKPELQPLIMVVAISSVLSGFNSTALFSQERRIELGPSVRVEFVTQLVGAVVAVAWAWTAPSVWALVGGSLAATLTKLLLSHAYLESIPHRLTWDRDSAQSLFRFGRWIFFSTVCTFVASAGDRLFMGHYLDLATIGIYSIALRISNVVGNVQFRLARSVMFPVLSRIWRDEPERVREISYKIRLRLDALFLPICGVLLMAGDTAVAVVYGERYLEAGWMLQLLAVRMAMTCLSHDWETVLGAGGLSKYWFFRNLARAIWILVGLPLAATQYGVAGMVWVVALSETPVFLVLTWGLARRRLLSGLGELRAAAFFAAGCAVGFLGEWVFIGWISRFLGLTL